MTELNDEDIAKELFRFRSRIGKLLEPLRRYGNSAYVDMVIPVIETEHWRSHWALEGIDEPPPELERPHW